MYLLILTYLPDPQKLNNPTRGWTPTVRCFATEGCGVQSGHDNCFMRCAHPGAKAGHSHRQTSSVYGLYAAATIYHGCNLV